MILELTVPQPYDFRGVRDYGWVALAPVRWLDEQNALQRIEQLASGKVVLIEITEAPVRQANGTHTAQDTVTLRLSVQSATRLTKADQAEIRSKVQWMLKLDEDLTDFYATCASDQDNSLWAKLRSGRGRLLRSSSVWEDVVKTICTTNTTWAQTKNMVQRLVQVLGPAFPPMPELHAFPTPEQVLAGEALFMEQVRMGYRNAYVLTLAKEIVEKKRDLEALVTSKLPANELRKELKRIKGIGDYAANTLLMALGHYDGLAIDTELRAFVIKKYFADKPVPGDREIGAIYERWGKWKYLAYWFDAWDI